ncbi:hypothetical protein GF386_05010 [Candidatus Pacearchaeota archaeon]|nr:hypothetical protein [Candidatus Pacearchaeota archaeon]
MGRKLSITAFVFSLLFFVPLFPIVGLILGIVALIKAKGEKDSLQGLAIAAIIIGALFGIFHLITLLGLSIGFMRGMGIL